MKIKAIISHRAEVPANLHRTYYHIKSHGVDVCMVEDNPAMGCGYRRHQAIMSTDADAVLICDAHMKFSAGYFEGVVEHLKKHPQDVTCSRMQSLDHDWDELPGEIYAGAYIKLFDRWEQNYFPICAKWRKHDTGNGSIGAVMGACYGMTVEHYVNMGQPLSMLRAWGCDEEILSIASWMSGGRVRLIDGIAYHMFAAPRTRSFKMTHEERVSYYANRIAIVNAIPMPDKLQKQMVDHYRKTRFVYENKAAITTQLDAVMPEIERVHDALSENDTDFSFIIEHFNESGNDAEEQKDMAKRIKADKQRVKRSYTQAPLVVDAGVKCPHCGHCYDHHITHTYPNGNRRRICSACNRRFISRRNKC